MQTIVAIASPKGGVGKTSTALNLAALLALGGRRALLVDLDPQGGASAALGAGPMGAGSRSAGSALAALVDDAGAALAPLPTELASLEVVPGAPIADIEARLLAREDRFARLGAILRPLRERYDRIFVDCPPGLGVVVGCALAASDAVIVPVEPAPGALEALGRMDEAIRDVKAGHNPALELAGILITMRDPASNLARSIEAEVRAAYGAKVFATTIPRDEALALAAREGRPLIRHRRGARATWAYIEMAKEMMGHERTRV